MKRRVGFVSNSSSMSFTMYGWNYDHLPMRSDEKEAFIKKVNALGVPVFEFDHPRVEYMIGLSRVLMNLMRFCGKPGGLCLSCPNSQTERRIGRSCDTVRIA